MNEYLSCTTSPTQVSKVSLTRNSTNPLYACNIPNFDLTLMGISPIDYNVTLMFYFDILGLGPHCIWTWWFVWYIKPVTYVLCMILCVGREPWSTCLMRCFVLSKELWRKWVFEYLCWAGSSGAHECLSCVEREALELMSVSVVLSEKLWNTWDMKTFVLRRKLWSTWKYKLEVLGISLGAFQVDVEHKLWNIRSLAIVTLGVSYKYILALVLSEELWNCTKV